MSLKNIQEISSVVTNYTKKTRFEALEKGSKTDQLIQGLMAGNWENDEEAEVDLYGKSLNGRSFDMLKSRAKEQLINTIFLLDTKRRFKSSYDKAYYNACKNLLAGLILINRNASKSGIEHLKLSLNECEQYHFTDVAVMNLRLLRYLIPLFGSKNKFTDLNRRLKEKLQILEAELRCEELNQILVLKFLSIADKESLQEESKEYYEECIKINSIFDTYSTRTNMYRIGIRHFDSVSNYKSVIKIADAWEDYLLNKPHLIQKVRLGEINLHKLYSALHLRDYKLGRQFAEKCSSYFNSGSANWLIFLEFYFQLSLHTNNIKNANGIFLEITSQKNFNKYPDSTKEKWKIFEAFLNYALPENTEHKKRFNVSRFLNEVPIFSKDKTGYNLSIIIAQVILLIKASEFEKVIERAEALKLYASRYIRKEKSPRSYYFLKMLLVMIKYDFDPVKTEQIAAKFYDKLKANHLGEQNELETLEVIPYDILWPKLLDQLKIRKQADR